MHRVVAPSETFEELRKEKSVNHAISSLTTVQLENIIRQTYQLSMDEVSHKLCLVSRMEPDCMGSLAVVAPITDAITSRLAIRFRQLDQVERVRLYRHYAKSPALRATASIFYESAAQWCIHRGRTIELVPMVRLPSTNKKRKTEDGPKPTQPQWYSSHVPLSNEQLETKRQGALQQLLKVDIPQSEPCEYLGALSIQPDIFYMPQADNSEALDSFMLLDGFLYIFQFTSAALHDMKPGLARFLNKCSGVPPIENWRFVFIIPPNLTLTCPEPWYLEMQKLAPYSAVLSVS